MRRAVPTSPTAGSLAAESTPPRRGSRAGVAPRGWLKENLEHSLPFVVGGVLFVGVAIWLDLSQPHDLGSRLSLWMLLAAVGVTLGGGGLALTLVEEPAAPAPSAPASGTDFVMVQRSEWEKMQRAPLPRAAGGTIPAKAQRPPDIPLAPPTPSSLTAATPTVPAVDTSLVEQVSADLLQTAPTGGPKGTAAPAAVVTPPRTSPAPVGVKPPASPPGSPPPVPAPTVGPGPAPARVGPAATSPPAPAWKEDALSELESVLAQVQRDVRPSGTSGPARPPVAPIDRCISCGASVTTYSEQACVVCDRPLCDACLERSVAEGRPAVCPFCPAPPGN